jgi:hypothetical protein
MRIEMANRSYNTSVDRRKRLSTLSHWIIVAFEDQAFLTPSECTKVVDALREGIGEGVGVWHHNKFTGSSDYNLLVPHLIPGPLPQPRHFRVRSLWMTLKSLVDGLVMSINETRALIGRGLIPDLKRDLKPESLGVKLADKIARAAEQLAKPVAKDTLPALLRTAGFHADEWRIDEEWLRRMRKEKTTLKLPLDDVLSRAKGILDSIQSEPKSFPKVDLSSQAPESTTSLAMGPRCSLEPNASISFGPCL